MEVTKKEAAQRLNVSTAEIVRMIERKELTARKKTASKFSDWLVTLPDKQETVKVEQQINKAIDDAVGLVNIPESATTIEEVEKMVEKKIEKQPEPEQEEPEKQAEEETDGNIQEKSKREQRRAAERDAKRDEKADTDRWWW